MSETDATQRIDIWLFRTRLFKSRRLAADLVTSGKLRLERSGQVQRITRSSFMVRSGDVLTFIRGNSLSRVHVLDCPDRRGPAEEARTHYSIDTRPLETVKETRS